MFHIDVQELVSTFQKKNNRCDSSNFVPIATDNKYKYLERFKNLEKLILYENFIIFIS